MKRAIFYLLDALGHALYSIGAWLSKAKSNIHL